MLLKILKERGIIKMKLRKWVKNLLSVIMMLCLIIGIAECDSTSLYVIKSIVSMMVFVSSFKVLAKYSDLLVDYE